MRLASAESGGIEYTYRAGNRRAHDRSRIHKGEVISDAGARRLNPQWAGAARGRHDECTADSGIGVRG